MPRRGRRSAGLRPHGLHAAHRVRQQDHQLVRGRDEDRHQVARSIRARGLPQVLPPPKLQLVHAPPQHVPVPQGAVQPPRVQGGLLRASPLPARPRGHAPARPAQGRAAHARGVDGSRAARAVGARCRRRARDRPPPAAPDARAARTQATRHGGGVRRGGCRVRRPEQLDAAHGRSREGGQPSQGGERSPQEARSGARSPSRRPSRARRTDHRFARPVDYPWCTQLTRVLDDAVEVDERGGFVVVVDDRVGRRVEEQG
mmetsp:Transcript_18345/g.57730  ORF Transcript_18345/g.57730 Transcript_18345/m.57730 type:complete len:258 (+) Transcript_18345:678-1451(+)